MRRVAYLFPWLFFLCAVSYAQFIPSGFPPGTFLGRGALDGASSGGSCNPPLLSCVTVPSGLTFWMPLDTSTTSGATTNDLSGNAINGTLTNSPSLVTAQIQQGVSLNGTNQYVQLPNSSHLVMDGSSGAFSATAWFKINSVADAMIFDNNIIFAECMGIRVNRSGNGLFNFVNGLIVNSVTTVASVVGVPSHIAVTWDGTTSKIYINGSLDNSGAATGATCGQQAFAIGADTGNNSNFFPGWIDDVRAYANRAITAGEVTSIYNAGVAGNP
jgi:hypothetical protein